MNKKLLLLLILTTSVYAAHITHTDYTSGTTITASGQNANENTIVNEINGNLDSTNIANLGITNANIANSTIEGTKINSNTTSFQLSSGTITTLYTSTITIGISGAGVVGTTIADNANAGIVGEYISSTTASSVDVPATTTNWGDLVSITLTAGDWDITGAANEHAPGGVTVTRYAIGISSTSGNSTAGLRDGITDLDGPIPLAGSRDAGISISNIRANVTTTTVYYLKTSSNFSGGNPTLLGSLTARRVR